MEGGAVPTEPGLYTHPPRAHTRRAVGEIGSSLHPDWLSALSARGGPLVAAARGFLLDHGPDLDCSTHGAVSDCATLLRGLAQCMGRWVQRDAADEDAERRFVEGAGALLGLILIRHVGDASHASRGPVHRIRLRQYGFFDPFAAIDRALDADNVRAALAREVSAAEAEAEGHGTVARVVVALSRALSQLSPAVVIRAQFEGFVTLHRDGDDAPIELDLQRAIESTRDGSPAAVEHVIQRYLAMLPGAVRATEPFDALRDRLLPRIARRDVLEDLALSGRSALFSLPLVTDLALSLVVQDGGRARYLRAAEAARFGVGSDVLTATALENLQACSSRTRLVPEPEGNGVFVARSGDGRDSARVLLPALYAALCAKLGPHLCVGLPHRDTFMVCAAADTRAVRALAVRVADDAARAPHRLSERLFLLGPAGLTPYALH